MAQIYGKILETDGVTPRPNALVAVASSDRAHPDLAAKSDTNGDYTLVGLGTGTHLVQTADAEASVEINHDEARVRCDLTLTETGRATPRSRSNRRPPCGCAGSPDRAGAELLPRHETASADPEPREFEESFPDDPYARDIDPVPFAEAGPVSISLIERGLVYAAVSLAIAQGQDDPDELTDIAWRTLNPTADFPISTADPEFDRKSAEWLFLKQDIVLPLAKPDVPKAGPVGEFDLVSVRLPESSNYRQSNNNFKFGLAETIAALEEIAEAWRRENPGIALMIRDISKRGGGSLSPPHSSHRCGCDADLQLWSGGKKVCMKDPRYSEWRPLMQDLVDIVRANPVLPVKAIGFSDREIRRVSHWSGHTCHAHVRFCAPSHVVDRVEEFVDASYADRPRSKRPRYRC